MEKLTQEQINKLKSPLPPEAITQHPTKSYLSSIKAIYVIERLNDVFGIGSWTCQSEVINDKTDMIVVRVILSIPKYGIVMESFGGNNNGGENNKNFDLGDAYKGATTDALTKACSYLEIGIDVYKGKKSISTNIDIKKETPKPIDYTAVKKSIKTKLDQLTPGLVTPQDYKDSCFEITGITLDEKNYNKIFENLNLLTY